MWLFYPKIKSNLDEIKSFTLQRILWDGGKSEGRKNLTHNRNIKLEFFPRGVLLYKSDGEGYNVVDAVTSVLVVIKLGRACVGLSQSQHWQWLVVGEGDLSHGEAPAKLSTGTGDSTTSAGAFRSQLRPGRRSNILHPHLPPPTTTQIPTSTAQHTLFNWRFTPRSLSLLIVPGWRGSGS